MLGLDLMVVSEDDRILARVVVVRGAERHPRGFGDVSHRRRLEAALPKQGQSRAEDAAGGVGSFGRGEIEHVQLSDGFPGKSRQILNMFDIWTASVRCRGEHRAPEVGSNALPR